METWHLLILLCSGVQLSRAHSYSHSNDRNSEMVNLVARYCRSSRLDCGMHGTCVIDLEGRPVCRCQTSKKYVWGGEECQIKAEVLPVQSEYILGVSLGVTVILVIALLLVTIEAYFKCWKKTGSRRNSISRRDMNEQEAEMDYRAVSLPLPLPRALRPLPRTPSSAEQRERAAFTGDVEGTSINQELHSAAIISSTPSTGARAGTSSLRGGVVEPFWDHDLLDEAAAMDDRGTVNIEDDDEVTHSLCISTNSSLFLSVTSDMLYRDRPPSVRSTASDAFYRGKLRSSDMLHRENGSKQLCWDGHLTYYNEDWESTEGLSTSSTPQETHFFFQADNGDVRTEARRRSDHSLPRGVQQPEDRTNSSMSRVFTLPRISSSPKDGPRGGIESRSLSSWACDHIVSQLSDTYYNSLPPRHTAKRTYARTEAVQPPPSTGGRGDNFTADVEAASNSNSLPSSRKEDPGNATGKTNDSKNRTPSGDQPHQGKAPQSKGQEGGTNEAASLKKQPASYHGGSSDLCTESGENCDGATDRVEPGLCSQRDAACDTGDPLAQRTYRVLLMGSLGPEPVFLYEPWRTSTETSPSASPAAAAASAPTSSTLPYGHCKEADLTLRTNIANTITATDTTNTASAIATPQPQGNLSSCIQRTYQQQCQEEQYFPASGRINANNQNSVNAPASSSPPGKQSPSTTVTLRPPNTVRPELEESGEGEGKGKNKKRPRKKKKRNTAAVSQSGQRGSQVSAVRSGNSPVSHSRLYKVSPLSKVSENGGSYPFAAGVFGTASNAGGDAQAGQSPGRSLQTVSYSNLKRSKVASSVACRGGDCRANERTADKNLVEDMTCHRNRTIVSSESLSHHKEAASPADRKSSTDKSTSSSDISLSSPVSNRSPAKNQSSLVNSCYLPVASHSSSVQSLSSTVNSNLSSCGTSSALGGSGAHSLACRFRKESHTDYHSVLSTPPYQREDPVSEEGNDSSTSSSDTLVAEDGDITSLYSRQGSQSVSDSDSDESVLFDEKTNTFVKASSSQNSPNSSHHFHSRQRFPSLPALRLGEAPKNSTGGQISLANNRCMQTQQKTNSEKSKIHKAELSTIPDSHRQSTKTRLQPTDHHKLTSAGDKQKKLLRKVATTSTDKASRLPDSGQNTASSGENNSNNTITSDGNRIEKRIVIGAGQNTNVGLSEQISTNTSSVQLSTSAVGEEVKENTLDGDCYDTTDRGHLQGNTDEQKRLQSPGIGEETQLQSRLPTENSRETVCGKNGHARNPNTVGDNSSTQRGRSDCGCDVTRDDLQSRTCRSEWRGTDMSVTERKTDPTHRTETRSKIATLQSDAQRCDNEQEKNIVMSVRL